MSEEKERRRLHEEDIELIAEIVATKISDRHTCTLTIEQQKAVADFLKQKNNAVKVVIWVAAAFFLWVFKDAYDYLASHITFLKIK